MRPRRMLGKIGHVEMRYEGYMCFRYAKREVTTRRRSILPTRITMTPLYIFCFFPLSSSSSPSAGLFDVELAVDVGFAVVDAALAASGAFGFFLTTIPFINDFTSFLIGFIGAFGLTAGVLVVLVPLEIGGTGATAAEALSSAAVFAANCLLVSFAHCCLTEKAHSRYAASSFFSSDRHDCSSSCFFLASPERKSNSSAWRPLNWFPSLSLDSHSSSFAICQISEAP